MSEAQVVRQAHEHQPQSAEANNGYGNTQDRQHSALAHIQQVAADQRSDAAKAKHYGQANGRPGWGTFISAWLSNWLAKPSNVFASAVAFFTLILALATRSQMKLTRDALTATERAFVYLKSIKLVTLRDGLGQTETYRLLPLWANAGTTPTKSMVANINFAPHKGDLPPNWKYGYKTHKAERLFLGPQAEAYGAAVNIPASALNYGQAEGFHLYLWGRTDYRDVFRKTEPHYTKFCFRILIEMDKHTRGSFWLNYTHYGDHNGSDHDDDSR